jgi:hypothetical protein
MYTNPQIIIPYKTLLKTPTITYQIALTSGNPNFDV